MGRRTALFRPAQWVSLAYGLVVTDSPKEHQPKENGPHTPGLAKESSALLAKERNVLGVGVETVGTDAGQAATLIHPSQTTTHARQRQVRARKYSNLDQLPPTGAIVIAAPLKIVGGSVVLGVIAITPEEF